jgi:UTP--glucose-1-phosphate uridylyltransferase
VKTTIEFALQRPDLRDDILKVMENILEMHKAVDK